MSDRLPPPWAVHHNEDSYWVEDASGQRFAFVYYRKDELVGTDRSVRLSANLARRITANVARIPDFIRALEIHNLRMKGER